MEKKDYLKETIKHIDIKEHNVVPMVNAMNDMAFQARNLARGAKIFEMMQKDTDCAVFLTLAGSLISAGLKLTIVDMIKNNMVDAIVSTGANIVDQDFFEALGFKHYKGTPFADDSELRELMIDRIYDTYIDEEDLRICDETIGTICNSIKPRPYSSREFIVEMGRYLDENDQYAPYRKTQLFTSVTKKVYLFLFLLSLIVPLVLDWYTISGIQPGKKFQSIRPKIFLKSQKSKFNIRIPAFL